MGFTADRLLLFGATGDLSQRMLLPSLCALHADDLLAPDLKIVGTARSEMTTAEFRNFAREALEKHLPAGRRGGVGTFLNRLTYEAVDATTQDGYDRLASQVDGDREGLAIFLSTAPSLFQPTISGLAQAGLTGDRVRIGLEKPLGTDLASSQEINDAVAAEFSENRIYRIDHYLGKETVQNLLALRFGNILFEPVWNSNYIDHVQITVAETVGLESRVAYYDDSGALRDMVQNHMLQLLALVAMEPPTSFDATAVRDEKVKVLRALRPVAPDDTVTGQYRAGAVGGQAVPGYDEELGKPSDTVFACDRVRSLSCRPVMRSGGLYLLAQTWEALITTLRWRSLSACNSAMVRRTPWTMSSSVPPIPMPGPAATGSRAQTLASMGGITPRTLTRLSPVSLPQSYRHTRISSPAIS